MDESDFFGFGVFITAVIMLFIGAVVMDDEVDYLNLNKAIEVANMCGPQGHKYIHVTGNNEGHHKRSMAVCRDGRIITLDHKPVYNHAPAVAELNTPVEHPKPVQVTETENKTVGLVDIQLYDETIKAVKGCKRAELDLLKVTEAGEGITPENHKKIMNSVLKCKAFELEKQINHKD